ncbi:hypothetical protein I4U23_027785 [Adineta vaga]|nr:hypothetical protein I4U23_027785 [Adineta vaga]
MIGIVASLFFMTSIFCNTSIHTVSNILTCNSSLAILILASDIFSISIYTLIKDLSSKQIQMYNMFLCHLRGYIFHLSLCALIHSFVIQIFYRLAGTIYYNRLYYQSLRPYLYAIILQWIIAIVQILPIIYTNHQNFIEEEYLCQIEIHNSQTIVYVYTIVYFIPLSLILIQYWIIKRYSKRKTNTIHTINIQHRARRQIKLIRRTLILITSLFILGTPYCAIIVLETLNFVRAPKYTHRIGFLLVGIASGLIMLMMIYFTRNLRRLILRKRRIREVIQSEVIVAENPY